MESQTLPGLAFSICDVETPAPHGMEHRPNVDHYYPLQGIVCCGLHVHHNLRVIPASQNCSKSNEHPMDSSPALENLTFSEERELMRALKAVA